MKQVRRARQRGFTLIELIITVAIVGLLAAIAIANLSTAIRKAKVSRAAVDTREIVHQTEIYIAEYNTPPTSIADIMGASPGLAKAYDPFAGLASSIGRFQAITSENEKFRGSRNSSPSSRVGTRYANYRPSDKDLDKPVFKYKGMLYPGRPWWIHVNNPDPPGGIPCASEYSFAQPLSRY